MPDPLLQPITNLTPQESATAALPNPQDMVDAALSGTPAPVAETPKAETLSPVSPLTSTPNIPDPEPVATTPAPPITPPPVTPIVAMGDDTPLAFAGATAPTSSSTPPASPLETNSIQPTSAPLPPVSPAPTSKKKGKLGKVLAGIAILVVVAIGGVIGYDYYTEQGLIAAISGGASGSRGGICPSGETYNSVRKRCEPNKTKDSTPNIGTGNAVTNVVNNVVGGISGAAGGAAGNTAVKQDKKKDDEGNGLGTASGSVGTKQGNGLGTATGTVGQADGDACTIGGKPGFRHGGVCVASENCAATDQGGAGCPTKCEASKNAGWTPVQEPGGGSYCDAQGRQCKKYRKELLSPDGRTHCFVGYGEQCGQPGSCGGGTTTLTTTPTMACTGLTSVPATTPAPTVGAKLTFTCAGSVTPSTAGTLTYKFRYSINNGAFTDMTNKTATTSELTINSCGTYKVQCQACATLNGVLTCDPNNWTGATQ
jgi:hypothetical protein